MRKLTAALICSVLLLGGCKNSAQGDGILNDKQAEAVAQRLEDRPWLPERTSRGDLKVQQAMDFLYAYMPYGDAGEYSEELFRVNTQAALKARETMSWGDSVPMDLFVHYVLPVRINNEALDTSRVVFYEQLKDRVEGMSMKEAILEINHWCHEKVVYTPTDGRTYSPSAIVRNAGGRCGEESSFTVAALRALGIPARQIYVPRWAHTDDNHAWVEAWADGTWYYIGACEPEAVLNKGWFDAPAKRSLLMFTKVFGDYDGPEKVIAKRDGFTEINVTKNYAPVKEFTVVVKDKDGNVVEGADVVFEIFNYGELHPIITTASDSKGEVSYESGLGDVSLWASKDGEYGTSKIDLRVSDRAEVILDKTASDVYAYTQDLVAPVSLPVNNPVSEEMAAENGRRWAQEDSIRGAYVATYLGEDDAVALAQKIGIDVKRIVPLIIKARGNSHQIADFLSTTAKEDVEVAVELLEVVSPKDLTDTPIDVLRDHLEGAKQYKNKEHFKEYILAPRVDRENLSAYRSVLAAKDLKGEMPKGGYDGVNRWNVPVSPLAVERLAIADDAALERYMIALYRSHGIPARRQALTARPEYFDGEKWVEIFASSKEDNAGGESSDLEVKLSANSPVKDPKYYANFSLAKLVDGRFKTVDMSHTVATDMGAGVSYSTLFAKPLELEKGVYRLITGNRTDDGSILMKAEVFEVKPNENITLEMEIRAQSEELKILGKINLDAQVLLDGGEKAMSAVLGDKYIVALVDAQKEPTTHFLRGLEAIAKDITQAGVEVMVVFGSTPEKERFKASDFPELPKGIIYGVDSEGALAATIDKDLSLGGAELPVVMVGDGKGNIYLTSTGYNTSIRDQIKGVISKLK